MTALSEARGLHAIEQALTDLLAPLGHDSTPEIVSLLARPVSDALYARHEDGIQWGIAQTELSVARRLGLTTLTTKPVETTPGEQE